MELVPLDMFVEYSDPCDVTGYHFIQSIIITNEMNLIKTSKLQLLIPS